MTAVVGSQLAASFTPANASKMGAVYPENRTVEIPAQKDSALPQLLLVGDILNRGGRTAASIGCVFILFFL